MSNLPPEATRDNLGPLMAQYGDIRAINVRGDSMVVEFEREKEAASVKEDLDNVQLGDARIFVTYIIF